MSETYLTRRIAALEAEVARLRDVLDMLNGAFPEPVPFEGGAGVYDMAAAAGFINTHGNTIWIHSGDHTEPVFRLALMMARAENEACVKICEKQAADACDEYGERHLRWCAAAMRARYRR